MNVIGASVSEAAPTGAHETRDIVLPNQTEHVSQIAVDVRMNRLNPLSTTELFYSRLVVH